jgi:hypothetical protein
MNANKWDIRRQIPYEEWLGVRDERNALALKVAKQAAYIKQLEARIEKLHGDAEKSKPFSDFSIWAQIDRMTGGEA